MARSLAAPSGRSFGASGAQGSRRPRRWRARKAPAGLLALISGWFGPLRARRRLRLALLGALAGTPLLLGGWLWLRDSPLVSVEHVQIAGVRGPYAREIEASLDRAARRMSTLDVRTGILRVAVSPFRVVREVRAAASFPHGLRIRVIEQLPVAALQAPGGRTSVAADGVVLGPALLSSSLPALGARSQPAPGQSVEDPSLRAALTVLGAAPAPLAKEVVRAFTGPRGLTVVMHGGLLAYFGDATRPNAKWLSLARVLADRSSQGASYVDVRLPERPAAGFPAGVAPPGTAATIAPGGEPLSSSESTVAALAAGLAAATAGGGSTTAGEPAGSSAPPPSSTPQAGSGSGSETPAAGSESPAAAAAAGG
jgi:cell division protein FtsQ